MIMMTSVHHPPHRIAPASSLWSVFFFQAEDGIRDLTVTGVQTCALPISAAALLAPPALELIFCESLSPVSENKVAVPSGKLGGLNGALMARNIVCFAFSC